MTTDDILVEMYTINQTHTLKKFRPVERRHQAHAGNHIANGHVHRRLPLVLHPDNLIGGCSLRRQAFFKPAQSRCHHWTLIAQPLDELYREGRC